MYITIKMVNRRNNIVIIQKNTSIYSHSTNNTLAFAVAAVLVLFKNSLLLWPTIAFRNSICIWE
jgi:hypothetical protein